jgi:hypothetical protein
MKRGLREELSENILVLSFNKYLLASYGVKVLCRIQYSVKNKMEMVSTLMGLV